MKYLPTYFVIQELVPPKVYEARGEKGWYLFDERILMTIDLLRERYGQATINNWHIGGNREWSGLRTCDSPYYSPYSQHAFGRAVDVVFKDANAEYIRQEIINKPSLPAFKYITAIELGTSWLHVDCRCVEPVFKFTP